MLLDIAFFALAFLFAIPAVTGYFAYSHGRSFWLWFSLGCLLPIISNIILALLCWKKALKEKQQKVDNMTRYEDEYMQREILHMISPRQQTQDKSC
ncbi:MAG: hypothetical protein RIG62_00365 [Cyclobacteriaceae bacterium]